MFQNVLLCAWFSHRVDIDEKPMFFLIWAQSIDCVQKNWISLKKVRMGDEHGGI